MVFSQGARSKEQGARSKEQGAVRRQCLTGVFESDSIGAVTPTLEDLEKKQVSLGVVLVLCAAMAVAAGGIGYWLSQSKKQKAAPAPAVELAKAEPVTPAAAPAEPELTDEDWDELIGGSNSDAELQAPAFDPDEMAARRERWENMTLEQRGMLRKAFGAAMLNVEGMEEVGDAIRSGKIDPRKFQIDLPAIADRMEIHAETMDQEAMNEEVTRSMQSIVDQARAQMK